MPIVLRVINAFYFWLALLLSWLFLNVLFDNPIYPFKALPIIALIFLWFLGTRFIFKKIEDAKIRLINHPKSIAFFILCLVSIAQYYCGYQLAIGTGGDVEAVFKGAINLSTQSSLLNYTEYFQIFPHNMGGTLLLSELFSLARFFGFDDYYTLGVLLNILCVDSGFFLVFLICKELKGCKTAFLSLWLCITCLPLYLYIPIFYTDIFSLPFVPLLYYIYLLSQRESGFRRVLFCAGLFGVACAIGSLIKFTVMIVAVAILIDILMRRKFLRYLLPIICSLLTYQVVVGVFNACVYDEILNKKVVERVRVPYTHWVMMGLAGNGAYNGGDYQYTYSYADPDERVKANITMIKQRLSDYGVWNYFVFATRKEIVNFGSGLYGVHEILDDNPLRRSALHSFVQEGGEYFFVLKNVVQSYHVFLFLLILLSLCHDLLLKPKNISHTFVSRLAISGIFIFLLLWEACPRYIINYLPIFIISAALGYRDLTRFFESIRLNVSTINYSRE